MKGLSVILTLALLVLAQQLAQRLKQAGVLPRQIEGAPPVNGAVQTRGYAELTPLYASHRLDARTSYQEAPTEL